MKIGSPYNKHQDKAITISELLLIEPNLTIIDLEIENKKYLIDLKDIIQFSKKVNDLSELDIDTQIEKITSYRFTIIKCIYDFQGKLKQDKRKFKNWYAGHYINTHKDLTKSSIKTAKFTDKYLENYLMYNHIIFEEYETKMEKIDFVENQINFLLMLDGLLSQRLEALRSVGKRRYDLKGGKYASAT